MENSIIPGAELRKRQLSVVVQWTDQQIVQALQAARDAEIDYRLPEQSKELLALNNAIDRLHAVDDIPGGPMEVRFSGRQSEEMIFALMARALRLRAARCHVLAHDVVLMAAALQAAR